MMKKRVTYLMTRKERKKCLKEMDKIVKDDIAQTE